MKKNYAILKEYSLALALLISTIFILHSCKKEPKRNSNDIKIEEAKLWLSQQKNAGAFDFDWNTARQVVGAKGSVFIVPLPSLTYNGKTITYNNLYIYKDDEGAVTGSVMYYMPEKEVLPIEVQAGFIDEESDVKLLTGNFLLYNMEGRLLRKHFALNNAFIAKPELQASTKSFKIRDKVSVLVSQLTYDDYYAAPGAPHDLPRPGCTDFFMCYTANEQVTAIAFMGRRCGALAMLEMEGDVPDGALMRLFRSGETAGAGAFKDIKNKTTDPCISKTVQAALDANKDVIGVIGAIISLFDASKKVTLNIYDGTTEHGTPGQYKGGSFVNNVFQANITLQTSYFKNSSKESVISTLIHESVHAYIHTSGSKVLEGDHETISKKYIEPMAAYLQSYFGMNIKDAYSMAWSGVADSKAYMDAKGTDTFKMSDGNTITKDEIDNLALPYKENGNDPQFKKGTPICN